MTPWITKPVPFNIGQGAAGAAGAVEQCPVENGLSYAYARIMNDAGDGNGRYYIGGLALVSTSPCVGSGADSFSFFLSRASGTVTTNISCNLYTSSSTIPTAAHTFGTIAGSELDETPSWKKFTFQTSAYTGTLATGNLIGIQADSGMTGQPDVRFQQLDPSSTYSTEGNKFVFGTYSGYGFDESTTQVPRYCFMAN